MKHLLRKFCVVALTCITGWSASARGANFMPNQPYSLCVGRFVVELPAGSTASIDATYKYIDILQPKPVESFSVVRDQLEQRAKRMRDANMKRDPYDDKLMKAGGDDPDKMYGKSQVIGFDVDDSMQQAVLGYHPQADSANTLTEVHRFMGGKDFVFQSKDPGAGDYPKTRASMWSAVAQFKQIDNHSVPSGRGFCVDGGMFADDSAVPLSESFTLVVRFNDHPDARFTIDANAITKVNKDEPSLRHRVDSELGILRANVDGHVGVIERGDLSAAGQSGYQIGISAPYDLVPGTQVRKFFWSADGVPNDVAHPFMEVDLTIQPTNEGRSTIKDDAEAKALWDALIQGIRIRPGSAG